MNTLTWQHLNKIGRSDSAKRYYPSSAPAVEYIEQHGYRRPSARYPYSYARALMTKKFVVWASVHHGEWLKSLIGG